MKSIIIYGSYYGSTKQYAQRFSKITGIPLKYYQDVIELKNDDLIIYFGGLYAGGIVGLKKTMCKIESNVKLIIVTVGLADIYNDENIQRISNSVYKQIPDNMSKDILLFHLRGAIDYQKLNYRHRIMMKLLYNKIKNMDEEKMSNETKTFMMTYGKKVNFIDYNELYKIKKALENMKKED